MGTRLYIKAPTATLEYILDVPAGAWEKTEEINARLGTRADTQENWDALQAALEAVEGGIVCDSYSTYGFGKLNAQMWEYLRTFCQEEHLYGGSTEDPEHIEHLMAMIPCERGGHRAYLRRNEVTKVYWS